MPRHYFDIGEDEQLSIKIRKYLFLFYISNTGYEEKDRAENAWKEIKDSLGIEGIASCYENVLPYFMLSL